MSIIAVIPARGGSKRIPEKILKILCGKPLISWTIEAAIKSPSIDQVFVSTDDEKLLQFPETGVLMFLFCDRRNWLWTSPGIEPVLHAIKKNREYKQVLLLQPTSPLRSVEDIEGICQFQKKITHYA